MFIFFISNDMGHRFHIRNINISDITSEKTQKNNFNFEQENH